MTMINHFYQNIEGWFNFQWLYSYIAKNIKHGHHYVEIGAWQGRSTAFLATEIKNSGKFVRFDVVDTWEGSTEHQTEEIIKTKTLYDTFIYNMKPVEGYYNPIQMESVDASELYKDNSLDFIFIDASHEYEDVKLDIEHWLPKLKYGGIIAGDDYHKNWPGVITAVNELLPNKIIVNGYSWVYEKPQF